MLAELGHFLRIVEHRTFTEAARRAHLSQPALTASIRRLEEHFGATLLHRGRAGATPTAAGEALVPHARAALAALEDGRRAVAEVEGLTRGEVRIAAGATAATYLLPPVLADFRRSHPKVRFLLRETTTDEALDALHAGEIDLAIVTHPEGDLWLVDRLVLVGAPGVAPEGAPFVTFRRGATSRQLFDRHFPDAEIVMELGSIAAVKGNVRAGIGLSLVSVSALSRDLEEGALRILPHPDTPIAREMRIVHRGLDRLPPAAAALRERLLADVRARAAVEAAPGRRRGRRRSSAP